MALFLASHIPHVVIRGRDLWGEVEGEESQDFRATSIKGPSHLSVIPSA
jgi:hypothetical protein